MVTTKLSTIVNTYSTTYMLPYLHRIKEARPKIFDFDYGVTDSSFKEHFETLFLIHFNDCQIAFESYAQFNIKLYEYCNKFLPIYYKKYELLQNLNSDSFLNVTMSEGEQKAEQVADTTSDSKSMSSDFPQDVLSHNAIEDTTYASTGSHGTSTSNSKGTSKGTTKTTVKSGSVLDKINTFDELFSNFWDNLLDKFEPLFLIIW